MLRIEAMERNHAGEVMEMMRVFYASPAVSTDGSEEIFRCDIENCLNGNPYLEGYVFMEGQTIAGYAMLARSFSTEFGKRCIWIEDIYLKREYCGKGLGSRFLEFVEQKYPDALLRLEVEEENQRAVHVYRKCGFETLPYMEMRK